MHSKSMKETPMRKTVHFLWGAVAGAAAAYWLDPVQGRARRAALGDKIARGGRGSVNAMSRHTRRAAVRVRRFRDAALATDAVLEARVRVRLTRLVSTPRAIAVRVVNGQAHLYGGILNHELEGLLEGILAIAGIEAIDNMLDLYEDEVSLAAAPDPCVPPIA
jgi:hypothetical protein